MLYASLLCLLLASCPYIYNKVYGRMEDSSVHHAYDVGNAVDVVVVEPAVDALGYVE